MPPIAVDVADQRSRFGDAERPTSGPACGLRQIAEEFAAIVIHAGAAADHELASVCPGCPGEADSRRNAPLTSIQCGIADTGCGVVLVVAGHGESCVVHG